MSAYDAFAPTCDVWDGDRRNADARDDADTRGESVELVRIARKPGQ